MAPGCMTSRTGLPIIPALLGVILVGLGASGDAMAQAPTRRPAPAPATAPAAASPGQISPRQIQPPPAWVGAGQTRTLADAMAITYATKPPCPAALPQLRHVYASVPSALATRA